MKKILQLALLTLALTIGQLPKRAAATVICDPMQEIAINMDIHIDDMVMKNLNASGIHMLSLKSIVGLPWSKEIPVKCQHKITFTGKSDPLSLSLQKGLLVTYKTCNGEIVYAFCQMDQDLEGEYPKDVNLCISPALGKCRIKVLCTQCP